MKNSKIVGLSISGTIMLLTSILIFVLLKPSNSNSSVLLGFLFLIFTELLLFGGLISIEFIGNQYQSIISRVGIGTSIIGYSVISTFISVICMLINTDNTIYFIITEIIALAISIVLAITCLLTSRVFNENDDKTVDTVFKISVLIERLLIHKENPKYGEQFKKIAEELHFIDNSLCVKADDDIESFISQIESELALDEHSELVQEYIEKLLYAIKLRKSQVRNLKHGRT